MEDESGVTRSIFDEVDSSDIQGDQMKGESGLTRSFFDEPHSWDIQGGKMEGETMVLLEGSLVNFILRISDEIKWKRKVVLLEGSLMDFIF